MFGKIGKILGKTKDERKETPPQKVTITPKDFFIDANSLNLTELLTEWRWLVPDDYQPFAVSALGDMFLRVSNGQVYWLDTVRGSLDQVASSLDEYQQLLRTEEKAYQWFSVNLIAALKSKGIIPGPDQCYSFKHFPILGGAVDPSNIELTNVYVHFGMLGEIHKQVKDLPPGTKIKGIQRAE